MDNLRKWTLSAAFSMGTCLLVIGTYPALFAQDQPPSYRVDPDWPKQKELFKGPARGVAVDKNNHVWVIQDPDTPAPSVMEFDSAGNLLKSWGGPGLGYDWVLSEHSILVDQAGNVWLSGNGPTGAGGCTPGGGMCDRQVLKFANDGKFLLQIGKPAPAPANSADTSLLGLVAGFHIDEKAREIYLADGYINRRVIVFDSDNGKFKRMWGAYGNMPDDKYEFTATPAQQFRPQVHCVHVADDDLVYACDRGNKRVQVFTKQGKFVKEFMVPAAPARLETMDKGYASDLAFSRDKDQNYLFAADGENNVIWILRRSDGAVVGKLGQLGDNPGQFNRVHSLAMDSDGNLYAGELAPGKRVQKFVPVSGNATSQTR